MEKLEQYLKANKNLFLDPSIQAIIKQDKEIAFSIVGDVIKASIPIPALSSALVYVQSMSRGESYGNLIQAQRDYFGAHGYQRIDGELNQKVHTRWRD